MNQKDFTGYVVTKFRATFPQINQYEVDGHKDVSYLEIASKRRGLKILISTRDSALTIGFSAGPGIFDWHHHLTGEAPIDEKIAAAFKWIYEILDDIQGIVYSSVLGPFPGKEEDIEDISRYRQENEIIVFKYWSDF